MILGRRFVCSVSIAYRAISEEFGVWSDTLRLLAERAIRGVYLQENLTREFRMLEEVNITDTRHDTVEYHEIYIIIYTLSPSTLLLNRQSTVFHSTCSSWSWLLITLYVVQHYTISRCTHSVRDVPCNNIFFETKSHSESNRAAQAFLQ